MVSELIRINEKDPNKPAVGGRMGNFSYPSKMPVLINPDDVKAIQFKDGDAVLYFRDGSKPRRVKDSPSPSKALQQQLRAAKLLQADDNTFVSGDAVVAIFASPQSRPPLPPTIVLDSGEIFETQSPSTLRALAGKIGNLFDLSDPTKDKDQTFIKPEAIKHASALDSHNVPKIVFLNKNLCFTVPGDKADNLSRQVHFVPVSYDFGTTLVNPLQVKYIEQDVDVTRITLKGEENYILVYNNICNNRDFKGTAEAINSALRDIAEAAESPSQGTHGGNALRQRHVKSGRSPA